MTPTSLPIPHPFVLLVGLLAGAGGVVSGQPLAALLAAGAAGLGAWALQPHVPSAGLSDASRLVTPELLAARVQELRQEVGRLEDERELQRGVFEVSSELVGCVDEPDARRRFAAALRRYWDCSGADLLIWERGAWRSLGGDAVGPNPVLDHPVTLPSSTTDEGGDGDLVLDLSPAVDGQAAVVLRRARPQPSLAGLSTDAQLSVAETLRAQLALSLRRVSLYTSLQALARTDPLTTTHRRWYGETRLKEIVDGGKVVCVAMVDIDFFKTVNDRYGHSVGDQTLKAVGMALAAGLRTNDLVCRWGGEEFLVVLPDTPPAGGMLVAERLREAVASIFHLPQSVTVSIGLAACAQDDTHFDLVARADEALYLAKRDGRNRVVLSDPGSGMQIRVTARHVTKRVL
jgi:diguanylate cyclase (GGDEF)-like protein